MTLPVDVLNENLERGCKTSYQKSWTHPDSSAEMLMDVGLFVGKPWEYNPALAWHYSLISFPLFKIVNLIIFAW